MEAMKQVYITENDGQKSGVVCTTRWSHGCLVFMLVVCLSVLGGLSRSAQCQDSDSVLKVGALEDYSGVETDPSLWVLQVDVLKVKAITLLEGPSRGKLYWYVVYQVENKGKDDREAFVSVSAISDDNNAPQRNYESVPVADVERAVERKLGQSLWGSSDRVEEQKGLEPEDSGFLYSTFKGGEKRKCVAIMNRLDPTANRIKIHFRGLSNDPKLVEKDSGERVIQERVFEVEYYRPGDGFDIPLDRFMFRKKDWLTVETKLEIPEPSE